MDSFNGWIERIIVGILRDAPANRLADFGGLPIFDLPAVGVSDGDDPIFKIFRDAVGPAHLDPRLILRKEQPSAVRAESVSVVSWALPFSKDVRLSNRGAEWPSVMYSVARNNGGALNRELAGLLVETLRAQGYSAVSPMLTDDYDAFRSPMHGFSSTWSERHVAFAAGLGAFGLNGYLITRLGAMVRLGSLITDAPLVAERKWPSDHRAGCLADGGKQCGSCIAKCPAGAILSAGLEKEACYRRRNEIRARSLNFYSGKYQLIPAVIAKAGKKEPGFSLGCALCASGVPCESADPFAESGGSSHA
jgi:ferredoxin